MNTRKVIRRGILFIIFAAVLFVAVNIFRHVTGGGDDLFYGKFFPPDFVIAKSGEIGLTDEQQHNILNILKDEANLRILMLDRANEERQLRTALNTSPFDAKKIEQHVSKMLEYENTTKKTHVTIFLRVRGVLTEDQAQKLRQLMGIKE